MTASGGAGRQRSYRHRQPSAASLRRIQPGAAQASRPSARGTRSPRPHAPGGDGGSCTSVPGPPRSYLRGRHCHSGGPALRWLSATAAVGSSAGLGSPSMSLPGRRRPTLGASVAVSLLTTCHPSGLSWGPPIQATGRQGKARQGNFIYAALFIHKADSKCFTCKHCHTIK